MLLLSVLGKSLLPLYKKGSVMLDGEKYCRIENTSLSLQQMTKMWIPWNLCVDIFLFWRKNSVCLRSYFITVLTHHLILYAKGNQSEFDFFTFWMWTVCDALWLENDIFCFRATFLWMLLNLLHYHIRICGMPRAVTV